MSSIRILTHPRKASAEPNFIKTHSKIPPRGQTQQTRQKFYRMSHSLPNSAFL